MERMNNRFNEEGWNEMLSKTRDLEEEVDELRRENNRTLSLNKKMAKDMIVLEKELEVRIITSVISYCLWISGYSSTTNRMRKIEEPEQRIERTIDGEPEVIGLLVTLNHERCWLQIATRLNDGCYNQKRKDEQSIQEYRQKRDKEKGMELKNFLPFVHVRALLI